MSRDPPSADLTVRLIAALARVWTAIRLRHPEVPGVVLLPAPAERGRGNVLGHFAALRWQTREGEDALVHEVVVVAEHLNRRAEDILETLLHEAAHALNFNCGIHDCSRNQYHNRSFREAAEELGLDVFQIKHYGFAHTTLPGETRARYADEIEELDLVLLHRRAFLPERVGGTGTTGRDGDEGEGSPRSRNLKATCACPYIIRVSRQTLRDTVIRCGSCGEPFRFPEDSV